MTAKFTTVDTEDTDLRGGEVNGCDMNEERTFSGTLTVYHING